MDSQAETTRELYTVGHSNHTQAKFLLLLSVHSIEVLIDTRSSPIPRRMPDAFWSRTYRRECRCRETT